jgi:hypothetical protein
VKLSVLLLVCFAVWAECFVDYESKQDLGLDWPVFSVFKLLTPKKEKKKNKKKVLYLNSF